MKKKIKQIAIILFVVLVTTVTMLVTNVKAANLRESTNPNDTKTDTITDGTIIIGVSKFTPGTIVTGVKAATAGANDMKVYALTNGDTNGYELPKMYYYVLGEWMQYDEDGGLKGINNIDFLDIYYVNNILKDGISLPTPPSRPSTPSTPSKIVECTVFFMTGEEEYTSKTVNKNSKIKQLPEGPESVDPSKIFGGWQTKDGEVINEDTKITSSMILFPKWNEVVDLTQGDNNIVDKSTALNTKYYNKYNNGEIAPIENDEDYYINLGEYKGTAEPTELTIGNNTYNKENATLSIGKNANIIAPVWKVLNGDLLVAIPWLCTEALPSNATEVTVGGQTLYVKLYDEVSGNLTLAGADKFDTKEGAIHTVEITGTNEVTMTRSYETEGLKLTLNDPEGNAIISSTQNVFRMDMKNNMKMAITAPEAGATYAMYPSWKNKEVTEAKTREFQYKMALPGKGVIEVKLICNDVLPEAVEPTPEITEVDLSKGDNNFTTKTEVLKETFYNKYTNGDEVEITEENEASYYIDLGEYTGTANPEELVIGEESQENTPYKKDDIGTLSIGKNAKVKAPIWKIKDNHVLVALPWLSTEVTPSSNETKVSLGGQKFSVKLYEKEGKALTLADMADNSMRFDYQAGSNHTVRITQSDESKNQIEMETNNRKNGLGFILQAGDESLVGEGAYTLFRLDMTDKKKMGITTSEGGFTYTMYPNYPKKGESAEVTAETAGQKVFNYKIAVPGKGVTTVQIKCLYSYIEEGSKDNSEKLPTSGM